MILFDSNVLIDFWRKPKELMKLGITPEKFSICGIVRAELLHGAQSEDEISDMLVFFESFTNLPNDEYDWEGTGFLLQTLRQNGIRIPLADTLIAFTAIKYDVPLWTRDQHFKFIQGLYPELSLYEG